MSFARRSLVASLALTAGAVALAFTLPASAQEKDPVIGATAGPYADQVELGIKSILEKKGYRGKLVEFNDYVQPTFGLARGSFDANAFQQIVYLTKFATKNGNVALASGLEFTDALALEQTGPTYQNLVAVRTADKEEAWVKDLADAYRSREFLAVTEKQFAGFVKTDYQQALMAASVK